MGLPKYIVNPEELAAILKDGVELVVNLSSNNLEGILKDYFNKLCELLEKLATSGGIYMQCSVGLHSYIPALGFDYELIHIFEEDVYITGITYSQTGWKVMDCWSLYIGGEMLFDGLFTKELGEHKHFNVFYSVQAGTEIKVVHHNNSGNSKQIWFDIDYLKLNLNPYIPPVPPDPPQPPDPPAPPTPPHPGFPAGRDWVIYVEWVNGGDIDCCWADAETGVALLGYKEEQLGFEPNRIYKDIDNKGVGSLDPLPYAETWSIEGRYRDKLMWGLGWWWLTGEPRADSIVINLYDGAGNLVDTRTDITDSMLGTNNDIYGEFLCVYEFDLTEPDHNKQWKRIDRKIFN